MSYHGKESAFSHENELGSQGFGCENGRQSSRRRLYQHNATHATLTGRPAESYSPIEESAPSAPKDENKQLESSPGVITIPVAPKSEGAGIFGCGIYATTATQGFDQEASASHSPDSENSVGQAGDWINHGHNFCTAAKDSVSTCCSSSPSLDRGLTPPPLPLPEFIAPRPATKQRYVLAGGAAKLEDRPEIEDFVLLARITSKIFKPENIVSWCRPRAA